LIKQIDENKSAINVQDAEIQKMQSMIGKLIGSDYKPKKGTENFPEDLSNIFNEKKKILPTQPITSKY